MSIREFRPRYHTFFRSSGKSYGSSTRLSSVVDLVMFSLLLMVCCFGVRAYIGKIHVAGVYKNQCP